MLGVGLGVFLNGVDFFGEKQIRSGERCVSTDGAIAQQFSFVKQSLWALAIIISALADTLKSSTGSTVCTICMVTNQEPPI